MSKKDFTIPNHITFDIRVENFPPFITMNSPSGKCRISLYGAQVLSFIPKDGCDLLWLGEKAFYQEGKAIRGGIPICFPWFGSQGSPSHGFARIKRWEVLESGADEAGNPHVTLGLNASEDTKALWDYDFSARLHVKLSDALKISLSVENLDDKPFVFTEALHSYFHISDISDVTLRGLEGCEYIDSLDRDAIKKEEKALIIDREVDRIYQDNECTCTIEDRGLFRKIVIAKEHSKSTVVWNPWIQKSSAMKDMAPGDYRRMLCVESANIAPHRIKLHSGEKHTLSVYIKSLDI